MKAIGVTPMQANSAHLVELDKPTPGPGEALVRIVRVGIDGTDKDINEGKYGEAPPGYDFLVNGHESFGVVEQVGEGVTDWQVGDLAVATVRRPDECPNCLVGESDMCLWGNYTERGIKGRHGYLTEYYVEKPDFMLHIPKEMADLAVLLEPTSVAEKGINQAYRIQERLYWQPKNAIVTGAGTLGLLATFLLRARGLNVYTMARTAMPYLNGELAEASGAHYVNSKEQSLTALAKQIGNVDFIFEATGASQLIFEAMAIIGNDGVLCLAGLSSSSNTLQIPADAINMELVLGNKLIFGTVNANRRYFQSALQDLAGIEQKWPGLLGRLFTHRVQGLDNFAEAFAALEDKGSIKVTVEISAQ